MQNEESGLVYTFSTQHQVVYCAVTEDKLFVIVVLRGGGMASCYRMASA